MAVAGGVAGGYLPSKSRQPLTAMSARSNRKRALRPQPTAMSGRSNRNRALRPPPPIFISTNPTHVNPHDLRDLYALCNHSCHRFPSVDSDGRVEPVDLHKLRIALSHSSVVVSIFCKPEIVSYYSSFSGVSNSPSQPSNLTGVEGDWFQRVMPVTPSNGQLVGFGRAISDSGLTGSIYDVMVIPSLRGMGIGQMLVQRIIRVLTSRGIYDIAALCSEEEREKGTEDYQAQVVVLVNKVRSSELRMGKIWLEVCLISARGLRRTSSLFRLQWYAVGWIDPNNKYCSRIDASGNANPVWKTKFSALVDNSESKFQDLSLHVEVYSREPIFLRERLHGTATVVLKEFLEKHIKNSEVSKPVEELGSFQLRKGNTSKTQGFVDVSIRISEEREEPSSYTDEGFKLMDRNNGINIRTGHGASQAHPPQFHLEPLQHPAENHPPANSSYAHPAPYPSPPAGGLSHPAAGGASYQPHRTPTPPPPPSNVGYVSTFLPRMDHLPQSYINMPSAGAASARSGGAGLGLGAGALAAGAVIFGDDFMSGFDVPTGLQDASVTIETNPPF